MDDPNRWAPVSGSSADATFQRKLERKLKFESWGVGLVGALAMGGIIYESLLYSGW